jgi:DNA-binding NtrC family response regulator
MKTSVIVDGDRDFLSFIERHLMLFGYQVFSFTDPSEFLACLTITPDLAIVGDNLREQKTHDFIRKVRRALPKSSIIHIAKPMGGSYASEALHAGASGFIEKDGATFVRLRTMLDAIEMRMPRRIGSFFRNVKKVFSA